jgi:hypothetical protein
MPVAGGHRFYFVGKAPAVFQVVALLLFANTLLMLLLEFAGKYFLPREVPETVRWYRDNSITIQFVLLALLAAILIMFRKRLEWWSSSRR